MGLLRVVLAISVVLFHSWGGNSNNYCIAGEIASVQCFYIISGFYMALILNEKYKSSSLFLFYSNRFFRLMPLYYFFLILSISVSYICYTFNYQYKEYGQILEYFSVLNLKSTLYIILSNLLVIGQDIGEFLVINPADGSSFLTLFPFTYKIQVHRFFLLPQSATLSLEFYFYFLVPFFLRRKNVIIIMILVSLITRVIIYSLGLSYFPWVSCVFPTELALFLFGLLSYRLYALLKNKNMLNTANSIVISTVIFILTFCYPFLPQRNTVPYFFNDAQLIYYSVVIIGLPFLFYISKQSAVDRFIGELSYPIYLCHLIIIPFFGYIVVNDKSMSDIFLILLFTVTLSLISYLFIQRYVDHYRQKRYLLANKGPNCLK